MKERDIGRTLPQGGGVHGCAPTADVTAALAAFLPGVDREALEILSHEVRCETLPRGAQLMEQGGPGDCLYFLVSGRLKVFALRDDGSEVRIGEVGPGEIVGEMALLTGEARSASVEASLESELMRLSKTGFDRLLAEHPGTMRLFTRLLVRRVGKGIRSRYFAAQLRTTPLATEADCEEVAKTEDLVLRNLRITQMYHRLSLELTILLGQQDANWCTFACVASKTAGDSIRKDDLPLYEMLGAIRRAGAGGRLGGIGALAERLLARLGVAHWLDAVTAHVSRHISAGNLKVFEEVAPVFSRFVQTFHRDEEYDPAKLEAFVRSFRQGATEAGGQDRLAQAIRHYHDATFEPEAKKKAELILLGNVKVGLHEQIRLQPHILQALDAPVAVALDRRLRLPERLGGLLGMGAARARSASKGVGRRIVTRSLMRLRLPYGTVRLGADVPLLPDERYFPDVLERLEHPELARLVAAYDRDVHTLRGSRAVDWGVLADRMNFIVDLFRSRQRSLELFAEPFGMEQRAAIDRDRIPWGRL